MKKITRMIIFSATSLFFLDWINSGVIVPTDFKRLLISILLIALIYYIINPVLKILLLPINIITLGFASFAAYILIFITFNDSLSLISFKTWDFPGLSYQFLIIKKFTLSPLFNKIFSAFFIASVISFLELLL